MKKLFAPLLAAATVAFAPAAFAQEQTPQATPSAEQMVDELCAAMAAEPVDPHTCTTDEKTRAVALVAEAMARPPATDVYQAARNRYDLVEGLRQIFSPELPPLALPPRDEFDVSGYYLCEDIQERFEKVCTMEQRDQLRALTIRMSQLPAPTTPAEENARQQEVMRELFRIFPDLPREGAPAADGASMTASRLRAA